MYVYPAMYGGVPSWQPGRRVRMATNDIVILQEQPDGSYLEIKLTPVEGQVLGFNASKTIVIQPIGSYT